MSEQPEVPKGTVEQLRETLERLLPQLRPDVEPALVLELNPPAEEEHA